MFVLVMGIVAAMVPQKVLAEDRAIAVVPQVYEANLILNGLDGKTENSWYSMLKSFREPLYYELTDYLLENKTLTWSSNFWNAAFNDQFRKNPSYFYEVMLMGFLKYEQKQVSMDGVWNSKEMSCALSIYKNLVDEYTDTYEGAALEEYIKKCNKLTPEEAVKEISKITDIRIGAEAISTLKKGCANGKELIDAVACH